MACIHWAGDGCTVPGCDQGRKIDASASQGLPAGWGLPNAGQFDELAAALAEDQPDTVTQLRRLLMEWEEFGRTMSDAGVIAVPNRLLGRTVGLLDATAV